MPRDYKMYINGEWVGALDNQVYNDLNKQTIRPTGLPRRSSPAISPKDWPLPNASNRGWFTSTIKRFMTSPMCPSAA